MRQFFLFVLLIMKHCQIFLILTNRLLLIHCPLLKSPLVLPTPQGSTLVPQGSLLGPRLLSIYVNDMLEGSKIGKIHSYADDTTAFMISKTVDEAVLSLNLIAKDIERCCNKNKLTINKDKTEYMIISS